MDGNQVKALAADMNLADTYDLYLASYKGVSPPMTDLAFTFRDRFGSPALAFLTHKAMATTDRTELEAAVYALQVSGAPCPPQLREQLFEQAEKLRANRDSVDQLCR